MKNAATPVLAATLLTREECIIRNIPRISDIHHMLSILEDLGANLSWVDEHTLKIRTPEILKHEMDYLLTRRMRSSVLLIGPVLSVLGKVRIAEPGGCNIGNRPLDVHTKAFESMGASVTLGKDAYYTINGGKLQGGVVELTERSVTATENALMAASRIPDKIIIKNAASEPHIVCLSEFLKAIGVKIEGQGTEEITVIGSTELKGAEFEIIPDQVEIGTIAVLGAVCGESITIDPVVAKDMKAVKDKLTEAGVRLEEQEDKWIIKNSLDNLRAFNIETAPDPGFPTDLQALFGLLATQAKGESNIYDPMFENRLGYINELNKMEATAQINDEHNASITGPTKLVASDLNSLDLRAGATLIIASLIAEGTTTINQAEIIDRGYEKIDDRLKKLGADIARLV
jgi:UDP-N-acetylglucosamine 1-carboxyvinyltransferase